MLYAFDAECPPLSCTVSVKFDVPGASGVPEIVPPGLIDNPPGSVPEVTLQVKPPVPPAASTVAE